MTEIDDSHTYRCRVKIREVSPIGDAAIPALRDYLDGKEFILRPMWIGTSNFPMPMRTAIQGHGLRGFYSGRGESR